MRLVSFERREPAHRRRPRGGAADSIEQSCPAGPRLGALLPRGAGVVDLNRAFALELAYQDAGAPEAEADSLLPSDLVRHLAAGAIAHRRAARVLEWTLDRLAQPEGGALEAEGAIESASAIRLLAPVARPGKIIAASQNYAARSAEHADAPPGEPLLSVKASSCVIGPGDEIVLPAVSCQVDYEGELAVVIGTACARVRPEDALSYVGGYTIANDVTARDFHGVRGQRYLGKSCDTFAPMGPALVTPDEIEDPQRLAIETIVSGETRQKADTSAMIFPVAELISFASQLMTLEPGDVILTGTPEGVGATFTPPRFLRAGDPVEIQIQRIGKLHNVVAG